MSLTIPGLSGKVTKALLSGDLGLLKGHTTNLLEFVDADRTPGTTDDTDAWQAMIDEAVATGAKQLLVNGITRFDPAELDWSALGRHTLIIDGELRLLSSFVRTNGQFLIGIGGATGGQFQIGPCCLITQVGTWTEPCIQFVGEAGLYGRGIYVHEPYGPGIQIGYTENDQSALCRLDNVGVLTRAGVETSEGLRIENTFWAYIANFSFCTYVDAGPSVNIADSTYPGFGNACSGLLSFTNGVIAGRGISLNRGFDDAMLAFHFWFKDINYEASTGPFLTIQSAGVNVSDILFDQVNMVDQVSGEDAWVDNTVGARLNKIRFEHLDLLTINRRIIIGKKPIGGVYINGTRSFRYSGSYRDYEDLPYKFWFYDDGEVAQIPHFRGYDLRQSIIPADGVLCPTDQALDGWSKFGSATVTETGTWLDGSSVSYKLVFPSGSNSVYQQVSVSGLTDHYMIAGAWFRAEDLTECASEQNGALLVVSLSGSTGGHWEDDEADIGAWVVEGGSAITHQKAVGWVLMSDARKWSASVSPTALRVSINSEQAQTFRSFRPFVLALPASAYTAHNVSGLLSVLCNVDVTA